MPDDPTTEERIFHAAREVFLEKGYDGARMQAIAERAGINQSMLHYYFRSKDRLFEAVFAIAARETLGKMFAVLDADLPLPKKIKEFVGTYVDVIAANPHVPAFVIQELRRNPGRLGDTVGRSAQRHLETFRKQIDEAVEEGKIRPIAPEHLIANMLAMCAFPFIARPILQTALALDTEGYDALLVERKKEVSKFILNALKP